MVLRNAFNNSHNQPVVLETEVPEPLANSAGRVLLEEKTLWGTQVKGDEPRLEIAVDAAMQAIGIKSIKGGGYLDTVNEQEVLRVHTNKGQGCLLLSSRPELRALYENYSAICAALKVDRNVFWEQERQEEDGPLLEVMASEEAALVAKIPGNHVRVAVTKVGDADGDPIYVYEVDGVKLRWDSTDLVHHGNAWAIRPGALGAFAHVVVASIPRTTLEILRAEQKRQAQEQTAAAAARRAELTTTPVPASAVAAYQCYTGDPERAWETEDEAGWAEIHYWGPYIEAQELESVRRMEKS